MPRSLLLLSVLLTLSGPAAAAPTYTPELGQAGKDVPWVPTPEPLVERMLVMAQVGPGDHVIDLGSGDGRTVLAAAKKFSARATGIEYDARLVAHARRRAAAADLHPPRVQFLQADIYEADFSDATVITLYLMPSINKRLRPKLLKMRPGTRVVSHQFAMDDWLPDETSALGARTAHLWIVPADVAGTWQVTLPGTTLELALDQKYQRVAGRVVYGDIKAGLREVQLRGDGLRFRLVDQSGLTHDFTGRVDGERMTGTVHVGGKALAWSATRTAPAT